MLIELDDLKYNIIIHDLVHISRYLQDHADINTDMYASRLIEIRQELLEATDTKD